jgi:hypothetical protein
MPAPFLFLKKTHNFRFEDIGDINIGIYRMWVKRPLLPKARCTIGLTIQGLINVLPCILLTLVSKTKLDTHA